MPGTFTDEQRAKYKAIFDEFDSNGDGILDQDELHKAGKTLGYRISMEEALSLLVKLDKDPSKGLTFDDFMSVMQGTTDATEQQKADCRLKFQEYDKDGNGFISPEEAQTVLHQVLGFNMKQTKDLVEKFDVNKDGQLSYEEFVAFYVRVKNKVDDLNAAFSQFDKDKKGYVSVDDAKRILGGFLFDVNEVEKLLLAHDENNDGIIQLDEFKTFWSA